MNDKHNDHEKFGSPDFQRFRLALLHLPDKDRQALILKDIDQMDEKKIARLLDITPQEVRASLARSVEALRKAVY